MPEVSVIIVCMDRPDLLGPCLESIREHTSADYEVLVVAYMFSPENLERMRSEWPSVRFIVNDSLAGFAENNNLALREAKGRFCFVVNDDTLMRMPVIDTLLADFEKLSSKVAAISPKIVLADGRVQTCGREKWTPWRYLKHYLHLVDEGRPGPFSNKEGIFRTRTLNGACFMIRTDIFREAGWFDETYTFTPEDIALGQYLESLGHECWVDAGVSITHLAGATAGPMETAIKPTRVKGSLIFYSSLRRLNNPQGTDGINRFRYALMAAFIWLVEAFRTLKWSFADRSDKRSRAYIMHRTARNVMRAVWSRKSTKEIFTELYKEVPR